MGRVSGGQDDLVGIDGGEGCDRLRAGVLIATSVGAISPGAHGESLRMAGLMQAMLW
ncbi:hypothetical protein [Ferrimicrobium sp.]|uniref:hypothetical protein n=1 Tax=Ferrimicrobium sp. TaxID=2926050 RepID=UPI00262A6CA8|nr:hypothetical protein [Ferrimicrobium sp.]